MLVLPDDMHGKKVGFTCSTFDLLHAGHILMLAEAKNICDHLIVAVQTDPTIDRHSKNKPVQSIVERYVQLSAVKFVDQIIVYETEKDLEDLGMSASEVQKGNVVFERSYTDYEDEFDLNDFDDDGDGDY